MSAFKQRMAKLGVRAGLLAGASAAVLAISGIGASSAMAIECPTTPIKIEGKGASLQKVAQEQWTGRIVPSGEPLIEEFPHKAGTETGYFKACPEAPVSYTSTGSGPGLKSFGFTGTATIENGTHAGEKHIISWASSDDAPTAAQITSAEKASGSVSLVFPVAETDIAVVVNPPEKCTLTFEEESGISYEQLNQVFGGKAITKWTQITSANPVGGEACNKEITRVVRKEGSGTTFQFKNYLGTLEAESRGPGMPCELKGVGGVLTKKWADMRAIEGNEEPNITWPNPANCKETTPVETAAGGGAIVKFVSEHPGTIGYAALPDVQSANNVGKKAIAAWLQNTPIGPEYANPEGLNEESNCGKRQYEVPKPGRTGETGEKVDWSGTFGAAPTIAGALYPLCTLTYAASWKSYEGAGYAEPAKQAENVKDYFLNYVLGDGQTIKHGYQALPSLPLDPEHDVLGAAKLAAGKIAK